MNRVPDYEERSKLVAELCDNDKALEKAREEIYGSLTESVSYLKDVVKNPEERTENRLKAAIEHCKLAGLYAGKSETGITITLNSSQADKIEKAASLMEGA